MATAFPDLTGVWTYDQRQELDNRAAIRAGHVNPDGTAALHGTWTTLFHFIIRAEQDGAILNIFDENGRFNRFVPASSDPPVWVSVPGPIDFGAARAAGAKPVPALVVQPSLCLDAYTADNCPGNKRPGDLFISYVPEIPELQRVHVPTPVPQQTITYHPDNKTFYWSAEGHRPGLEFSKVRPAQGVASMPPFGTPFTAQSKYAQVDFPFYGFDPRSMAMVAAGGKFDTPGTAIHAGGYPSNPGQSLHYNLLFKFPAADSRNYQQFVQLTGQPNLPIGRSGVPIGVKSVQENSTTLARVADRAHSSTSTIGFSAGAEQMLTVGVKSTFGQQAEAQVKNESRYTLARTALLNWADVIDVPSLEIHDEFGAWVLDRTHSLLRGEVPDWEGFVGHFGTHYVHAMTRGWLECAETRMSLEMEAKANTTNAGLAVEASVTLKGATAKVSSDVAQQWKNKLGLEHSAIEVNAFTMGSDSDPLAILYDLRPLTGLLTPVLFPYNPAEAAPELRQLAPWIWTSVRASLEAYLRTQGLYEPLGSTLAEDYTPQIVKVTFPKLWMTAENLVGDVTARELYASGEKPFTLSALDGDPAHPDQQLHLSVMDAVPQMMKVHGDGAALSEAQLSCALAMRRNAKPRLRLAAKLGLGGVGQGPWGFFNIGVVSCEQVLECDMQGKQDVTQDLQLSEITVTEGPKDSRRYRVYLRVRWQNLGSLGSVPLPRG